MKKETLNRAVSRETVLINKTGKPTVFRNWILLLPIIGNIYLWFKLKK